MRIIRAFIFFIAVIVACAYSGDMIEGAKSLISDLARRSELTKDMYK